MIATGRTRIALLLAVASLAVGVACGSGSGPTVARGGGDSPAADAGSAIVAGSLTVRDLLPVLTRHQPSANEDYEITFMPPLFFEVMRQPPPPESLLPRTAIFVLQESVHDGELPLDPPQVFMRLPDGGRIAPAEVRVVTDGVHHRSTRLVFSGIAGLADLLDPEAASTTITLQVVPRDGDTRAVGAFVWQLPLNVAPQ